MISQGDSLSQVSLENLQKTRTKISLDPFSVAPNTHYLGMGALSSRTLRSLEAMPDQLVQCGVSVYQEPLALRSRVMSEVRLGFWIHTYGPGPCPVSWSHTHHLFLWELTVDWVREFFCCWTVPGMETSLGELAETLQSESHASQEHLRVVGFCWFSFAFDAIYGRAQG